MFCRHHWVSARHQAAGQAERPNRDGSSVVRGRICHLLSTQLIIADDQQRLIIRHLLTDEIDQILYTLELALTATADMLDTAAPFTGVRRFAIANDKPEQKGFDTPVAHVRNS
jgi:hypothetical protein